MPRPNPFLEPSSLPFQAPPFDQIEEQDYQTALREGMAREMKEVHAIATNPEPPTFSNTIEALERAGSILRRVSSVFHEIADSTSTPGLRRIDAEEAPRLAAHQDAIYLNAQLFERVKAVYNVRDSLGLTPEAQRLVERRYRDFVHAGAGLDDADQQTLRSLNEEHARLVIAFRDRLLEATNAATVIVDDQADLRGLTPPEIAAAAERAAERRAGGRYVLPLQNTTQQPVMASIESRELRRRILRASMERGRGGADDTTAIAARLAQIRAHRAKLLGFSSFAALELDDQMARTPDRSLNLLTGLVPAAIRKVRDEAKHMQAIVDQGGGGFEIEACDWPYLAEQVRRRKYEVDTRTVRAYFELDRVVHDGVFFAATSLFGITFRVHTDIPVYHPEVRVWEVADADGSPLALFYGDFFARPSKSGGAWSHSFVGQSTLLGTRPVVVNVLNLMKPAPGDPVLLTIDEVETLFHEFGHALHAFFSNATYPTLAGTNVPRDWVEFPSQINEHWAWHPSVFTRYARHWESGDAMSDSLYKKIRELSTFNQGYRTTEYLSAALLDYAWHTLPSDAPLQDVGSFESKALDRFGLADPVVPPRYSSPYLLHIWGRGYAAAYYAYIWAEVLEQDAFRWIEDHGGLTRENGDRLRQLILSRGDTEDGDVMFRKLCGRDPDPGPLLAARGLQPQPSAADEPKPA